MSVAQHDQFYYTTEYYWDCEKCGEQNVDMLDYRPISKYHDTHFYCECQSCHKTSTITFYGDDGSLSLEY